VYLPLYDNKKLESKIKKLENIIFIKYKIIIKIILNYKKIIIKSNYRKTTFFIKFSNI